MLRLQLLFRLLGLLVEMGKILTLLASIKNCRTPHEMGKILIAFGLFSTKSLKMAEVLTLFGEVCEIIILLGVERGLPAHGRSLGAPGRNLRV